MNQCDRMLDTVNVPLPLVLLHPVGVNSHGPAGMRSFSD